MKKIKAEYKDQSVTVTVPVPFTGKGIEIHAETPYGALARWEREHPAGSGEVED